jgi:hypothetical protein
MLAEIEKRFAEMTRERERKRIERGEPVAMGSFGEDQPFLHFLHAPEREQLRVAERMFGLSPEDFK